MPSDIRPLRRGNRFDGVSKPHETALCQKCKELGYDCRNYVPPQNNTSELVEIPDDQSIISEASTASTASFQEYQKLSDEDLTPVASDEEETDTFLESKMKSLNIAR